MAPPLRAPLGDGRLRQFGETVRSALPATYARLSDADLAALANLGDDLALSVLIDRYQSKVSKLTAQLLDDIEDARDAAQDCLLKISTRLRQFRGEAHFSTWLHRLVVNTCRDVGARQEVRRSEGLDAALERFASETSDPSARVLIADLRRELVQRLSRLSPEQQQMLVLRDAFGFTYEEIARSLRVPVGTVKSYVHRARLSLRADLEEYATA